MEEIGKRTTIIVLGVITLCELFYTHSIADSAVLWFGYGMYKGLTD